MTPETRVVSIQPAIIVDVLYCKPISQNLLSSNGQIIVYNNNDIITSNVCMNTVVFCKDGWSLYRDKGMHKCITN